MAIWKTIKNLFSSSNNEETCNDECCDPEPINPYPLHKAARGAKKDNREWLSVVWKMCDRKLEQEEVTINAKTSPYNGSTGSIRWNLEQISKTHCLGLEFRQSGNFIYIR